MGTRRHTIDQVKTTKKKYKPLNTIWTAIPNYGLLYGGILLIAGYQGPKFVDHDAKHYFFVFHRRITAIENDDILLKYE